MTCQICGRPATFIPPRKHGYRQIMADKMHDLCQRCWRAQINSIRTVQEAYK